MSDWRYRFAQNRATLLAFVFFIVMFAIYSSNHPAGFSANVVQTAANKGVLLALVAMAQTFVVITAGIDLSVGMVFVLTNCLASWIVVGTATRSRRVCMNCSMPVCPSTSWNTTRSGRSAR